MQNLSDDDRFSTQLEGKKLKGFGAKLNELLSNLVKPSAAISHGTEIDAERGMLEEELIFDDLGREQEERKKREAMLLASSQQKQLQKSTLFKKSKTSKESGDRERDTPEKAVTKDEPKQEIDKIKEAGAVKVDGVSAEKQIQQEVVQGKNPVIQEAQIMRETAAVRQEALVTQAQNQPAKIVDAAATLALLGAGNAKHLDNSAEIAAANQKQAEFSPSKGLADLAKMIMNAVLPTQLPDVRDGKAQGQDQGGQGRS